MIGIAWYKREDYDTLRNLFPDGADLPDTYDEWLTKVRHVMKELGHQGMLCRKVPIDLETFPAWCAERGLAMNTDARTHYSAEAVRERPAPRKRRRGGR